MRLRERFQLIRAKLAIEDTTALQLLQAALFAKPESTHQLHLRHLVPIAMQVDTVLLPEQLRRTLARRVKLANFHHLEVLQGAAMTGRYRP